MLGLHDYLRYCERRGYSNRTITAYREHITNWGNFLDKHNIKIPGAAEAEAFLDRPELSASTRSCYASWLSAFTRWATLEGIYPTDPMRKIHRPFVPTQIPKVISEADLEVALASAGPRMHLWLLLGAKCGLRCKEIAGVHTQDLYLDANPATLTVSNPKGRRQRTVPLNDEVVTALRDYPVRAGYLFPGGWGAKFINPSTVSGKFTEFFQGLGIDATGHALRHRYGTRAYALSKDIRLVQDLLGHRSPVTTAIYTHLDHDESARVVAQL